MVAFSTSVSPKNLPFIKDVLTWVAPALSIPALRYFQDSHEQRRELFVRDASTYSLGAALFLGSGLLSKRLLNRWGLFKSASTRDFAAFLIALGINILYAGVGAVQFSKAFRRRKNPEKPVPPVSPAATPPIASVGRPPYFAEFRRMQYFA